MTCPSNMIKLNSNKKHSNYTTIMNCLQMRIKGGYFANNLASYAKDLKDFAIKLFEKYPNFLWT